MLFLVLSLISCKDQKKEGIEEEEKKQPNIIVIYADDLGFGDVSAYGSTELLTPNIDRIAKEGMMFTDYYSEQSCTAGRSSFILGQSVLRTGLSKVGMPGAAEGISEKQVGRTITTYKLKELVKNVISNTLNRFGKNNTIKHLICLFLKTLSLKYRSDQPIDVSNYSKGVYFIKLTMNGQSITKKWLIQP